MWRLCLGVSDLHKCFSSAIALFPPLHSLVAEFLVYFLEHLTLVSSVFFFPQVRQEGWKKLDTEEFSFPADRTSGCDFGPGK